MIYLFAILLHLSWSDSNIVPVTFRVYERCATAIDGGGWFTDYTETRDLSMVTDVEPNRVYSFTVTSVDLNGVESEPCPAIWVIFVRDKSQTAANK